MKKKATFMADAQAAAEKAEKAEKLKSKTALEKAVAEEKKPKTL